MPAPVAVAHLNGGSSLWVSVSGMSIGSQCVKGKEGSLPTTSQESGFTLDSL